MENGYYRQGWTSMRNEEFHEEDIWRVLEEEEEDSKIRTTSFITRRTKTSHTNSTCQESRMSKIYGLNYKNKKNWESKMSKIYGINNKNWESDEDEDKDKDGKGHLIPPHEWIARRRISSFSVCEGAGRTLKGRDLSRVRNAVLTKTGFLESKFNY